MDRMVDIGNERIAYIIQENFRGDWDETSYLYEKEIERTNFIYIDDFYMQDLKGLEYLYNLEKLSIKNCPNIINYDPIKELKNLNELEIENCGLENINFISKLTNLSFINFMFNNITNITPMKNLLHLISINLFDNNISDIRPLKDMKNLRTLNVEVNDNLDINNKQNNTVHSILCTRLHSYHYDDY